MINSVSKLNLSSPVEKGKKVGTRAGLAGSGLYILKNKQDIFVNGTKDAVEKLGSKGAGYAIAGVVCAGLLTAGAVAGRLAGGLIGKAVEKIQQKKAEKLG